MALTAFLSGHHVFLLPLNTAVHSGLQRGDDMRLMTPLAPVGSRVLERSGLTSRNTSDWSALMGRFAQSPNKFYLPKCILWDLYQMDT